MAKSVENVEKLLDDLTKKITPLGRDELQKLTDFKRTFKGHEHDDFEKWDHGIYSKKYDEKMLGYDESEIS